jgi:hypothetical protein
MFLDGKFFFDFWVIDKEIQILWYDSGYIHYCSDGKTQKQTWIQIISSLKTLLTEGSREEWQSPGIPNIYEDNRPSLQDTTGLYLYSDGSRKPLL